MDEGNGTRPPPPSPPAATSTPPWTINSCQRDPQIFAGLRGEEVEDMFDNRGRVSAFNRWEESHKLLNVVF
ncbi:hypothetical protein V5799_008809 [Amblyomma americanum]|uniref:Uncharacterized protein n=1 Tax=Amblyomma americanum TaxID=6943 RepID=A0AAQ4FCX1_AMBAM